MGYIPQKLVLTSSVAQLPRRGRCRGRRTEEEEDEEGAQKERVMDKKGAKSKIKGKRAVNSGRNDAYCNRGRIALLHVNKARVNDFRRGHQQELRENGKNDVLMRRLAERQGPGPRKLGDLRNAGAGPS